jgi:Flp pilus assembly protein TadG
MGPEITATDVQSPIRKTGWHDQRADDAFTPGVKRGQILIMFALMLTALLGAVGLSVDLGMAFSQRRTMQSAADAGAYAGAWAVLKSKAVQSEVDTVVNQNKMNFGTVTSIQCEFINDASQPLGSCSGAIPSSATGVRVTVTENHPTFFIKVVPGAPNNVTTSAVAAANIRVLPPLGGGPFLPCSKQAIRTDNGETMDLVFLDDNYNFLEVNDEAVGVKFNIYGPNDKVVEDCGIAPDKYNGAADQSRPCVTAPGWCYFKEGSYTGPVNQAVDGIDGCQAGAVSPYNCVAFLPIATIKDQPLPANADRVWVVAFLPFYIEQGAQPNKYYGTLLDDYAIMGLGQEGSGGWTPDYHGPVTIRLTL